MSIGMRWPIGENNDLITDFGIVEYPQPRPELDEVGTLCIAPRGWVYQILETGPVYVNNNTTVASVTEYDQRMFLNYTYGDSHWVWEMFEAHFESDSPHQGAMPMMIGRWPD